MQIRGDGGQGGVGDRGIERGERDREHDRGHRAAIGGGHRAVRWKGLVERGATGGAGFVGQGVARRVMHAAAPGASEGQRGGVQAAGLRGMKRGA